ncbi:polysaccharide biosynthesis/export family protein [Lysobacter sp. BMK333-48F3]|uniref:polysaccharide biosynthesis/export family protein n=1 Tax=Lysobacter sp. BMK333-48F3 TaxID=2867962 RepID=UPI002102BB17|nr:polysaccharide biosynthesis/export family protein [Lysobacter sp. BMK333-48F3]
MRKLSVGMALLAAIGLNGCMWAPGQHMSPNQLLRGDALQADEVELVPINAQLVASERASADTAAVPAELLDYQPEAYRIGAGDTLYITIWDHPELTSPAGNQQQPAANGRLVRPDGTLFYPYVGVIQARGKTIEELRSLITQRIAAVVESPQVDVTVIDYGSQQVTLQGAFVKTERQRITATPLTLAQAIGSATIDPLRADLSGLVLTRDGHQYPLDLDALNRTSVAPDIYLKAGDHIYLPYNDRKEVYVVGEVVRPAAIGFKTTDMSLSQVLGRAGGLNPLTANGDAVYVIRGGSQDLREQPAKIYHLAAKSPATFALASQFSVRPGDVVFVGPAGVTRWNRFVNQLLPFSNILNNSANTQDLLER